MCTVPFPSSLSTVTGGNLWAAGENKEGQCGLGTPKAELLRQHISAFQQALVRVGLASGIPTCLETAQQ